MIIIMTSRPSVSPAALSSAEEREIGKIRAFPVPVFHEASQFSRSGGFVWLLSLPLLKWAKAHAITTPLDDQPKRKGPRRWRRSPRAELMRPDQAAAE
jgi:hypothetical protein